MGRLKFLISGLWSRNKEVFRGRTEASTNHPEEEEAICPDELKNNKYWAKRCKNNEAAKRSREARRLKENQIAMRARFLEEENTALKGEVEHLKKENSDLKQMMMALEEKLNQMTESR